MTKKVAIIGAGGRMGQAMIRAVQTGVVQDLAISAAVERPDFTALGSDAGAAGKLGVFFTTDVAAAARASDVMIDFSFHTNTAEHARISAQTGVALVVGTTGMSADEEGMVHEAAKKVPVVFSANMSLGMNLLFSLVKQASKALSGKGYDVEIIERHHRRKKDAPSGSAVTLAKSAADGLGWDLNRVAVHGRSGLVGERPGEQIGIHAVRGGDIIGDHTVLFAAEGECLELSHRATSRETFALGALRAAAWVAGRKPGLYTMQDVLGL
ncbi:MAG: 4-hydroxy-tetrahydrodipicolinate reductase [Kiritimatiellia bacterium]